MTWLKCVLGQTGDNCELGSPTANNYDTASSNCASLAFAGKNWNLPTIDELESIILFNKTDSVAAIDPQYFPNSPLAPLWSMTNYIPSLNYTWVANFSNAKVEDKYKITNSGVYTRCVFRPDYQCNYSYALENVPGYSCGGKCGRAKYQCVEHIADVQCVDPDQDKIPVGYYCGASRQISFSDTGQDRCYNDLYPIPCPQDSINIHFGQDGNYANNPLTFYDYQNGTINDGNTNLYWEKCSAGLTGANCETGSPTAIKYSEAFDHCYQLASQGYAGLYNWRLPTHEEFTNIMHFGKTGVLLDATAFPATTLGSYWTSTIRNTNNYNSDQNYHYLVNFGTGEISNDAWYNSAYYVRCVSQMYNY